MIPSRHLSAAHGYIKLGLFEDALEELQQLPEAMRNEPGVLAVWLEYYMARENWPEMRRTAVLLTNIEPENSQWWISLAYASRRAESIAAAREVLLIAEELHPVEPTIQFNLGCYACQMGEIQLAREYVERSISMDSAFREMAGSDPDLEPLREAVE